MREKRMESLLEYIEKSREEAERVESSVNDVKADGPGHEQGNHSLWASLPASSRNRSRRMCPSVIGQNRDGGTGGRSKVARHRVYRREMGAGVSRHTTEEMPPDIVTIVDTRGRLPKDVRALLTDDCAIFTIESPPDLPLSRQVTLYLCLRDF